MRAIFKSQACLSPSGLNGRTDFFRRSVLAGVAAFTLIALTYSAHTQGNQPAFMSFQSAVSGAGRICASTFPAGTINRVRTVTLAPCTGGPNQMFGTESGALTAGGLCLDAHGAGAQSRVTMAECSGGGSQAGASANSRTASPIR